MSVRAREIAEVERARLLDSTPVSHALFERAKHSMPLGVGSSFQVGGSEVLTSAIDPLNRRQQVDPCRDVAMGEWANADGHTHNVVEGGGIRGGQAPL